MMFEFYAADNDRRSSIFCGRRASGLAVSPSRSGSI